jgi:hypothetical protein
MLFFVTINGCANHTNKHNQIENSLLQANRRLEEALIITHNQLVELKRENESLKTNSISPDIEYPTPLSIIKHNRNQQKTNEINTPIQPPQIIIPENGETTNVPDSLKGTLNNKLPSWTPNR